MRMRKLVFLFPAVGAIWLTGALAGDKTQKPPDQGGPAKTAAGETVSPRKKPVTPAEADPAAGRSADIRVDTNLVLINVPAGDLMQGGDGLACVPGQEHLFQEAVQQALRYAAVLNIPSINILAGRQPVHADLLPCLETLAKNLRYACDEFSKVGVTPVFEIINSIDMPRFIIHNVAQAQEMLEAVHHSALKIQLDFYHLAMMNEPLLDSLKENLPLIGHIQFADCPNRHEPGTGEIDFAQLFDYILHSHYQGFTGAEYRPLQNTTNSLDWLKRFA